MARREEDPQSHLHHIIAQLQELECDALETLEPQWVYSVLVSPGRPRQTLLKWVFARLCPSEYSNLSTVPPHVQEQKIFQSLTCMGICLPGDSNIVEGSAPEAAQLKFWRTCLDAIHHLHNFLQARDKRITEPHDASVLLARLAHSPHLLPTLRGGEASLVPEDLKDKYQAWCKQQKHSSVSESLRKVKEQLCEVQEKHKSFDKVWDEIPSAEEHHSLQASVEQALANLSKQQEVMQGVYSTYIAPWTTSTTHLELPTTGPLVEETESKLSSLVKALKTTEEILHNCEKLEEQEKAILKASHHPSCISTTLHSLVAEAGRPQDGL
ncbi:HAUS augmin-like complex subunit 7 [Chionoecetes opilio]|uniref:HAUS augmin-like complex subunit 7 n=1 Tax=Chionoecetes opilio TaxID=41210 RepID=A0A8J4YGK4_CHIOP|nr:HAUS augmin-like complex subunit 7 [Chionoecetes opilio]